MRLSIRDPFNEGYDVNYDEPLLTQNQSLLLELHHLVSETGVHFADHIFDRNVHVFEVDHRRVAADVAELLQLRPRHLI